MIRTLVSNDDGVNARGIHVLHDYLAKKSFHPVIVAPEREQSTTGHKLTLHKPLRIHKLAVDVFAVSGVPADCIYLGAKEIMRKKPDLVVSGINRGANLGQDVFYSGTVSAAREAAIAGIPAVSVSLVTPFLKPAKVLHYETAAYVTEKVIQEFCRTLAPGKPLKVALKKWPNGLVLNINVPNVERKKLKGIRAGTQGRQLYSGTVLKRKDARGRKYYWIGGSHVGFRDIKGSDCWYVDNGYAAVTPLEVDTTDLMVFGRLQQLFE